MDWDAAGGKIGTDSIFKVGPTIEFAYPAGLIDAIQHDDDLGKLLPFLALPDGAHLSEEDYSYFVSMTLIHMSKAEG